MLRLLIPKLKPWLWLALLALALGAFGAPAWLWGVFAVAAIWLFVADVGRDSPTPQLNELVAEAQRRQLDRAEQAEADLEAHRRSVIDRDGEIAQAAEEARQAVAGAERETGPRPKPLTPNWRPPS